MTDIQLFAFIVLPIAVACLGWGAAFLHDRAARAERRREGTR